MVKIRAGRALTRDGWRLDVDVLIAEDGRVEAIAESKRLGRSLGRPSASVSDQFA